MNAKNKISQTPTLRIKHLIRFDLSHILSWIYFLTWIYLVTTHIDDLEPAQAKKVFMNALIIALFVGLNLNVNAFQVHAKNCRCRTLSSRIKYICEHVGHVLAFYIIPFCVASASSLVVVSDNGNLVSTLFGTGSYTIIIASGFLVFILLPALYILYRHGWK